MVDNDVDVCVVGAGPHGLTVTTHLLKAKPSLRGRISVVDPSGCWLRTWTEQFARLDIGVLRSPIVHHPDVDPLALSRFASARRLARSNLPYDPPVTEVFERFCRAVIDEFEIDSFVSAGRVEQLDQHKDGFVVATEHGSIRAGNVIWTGNPAVPIIPEALQDEMGSNRLQTAAEVDLRRIDSLDGEHVIIVGGGLTAGHLVVGALERSAHVTLVTRRPIVERDFDVEPGWLGPKNLDGFERLRSPKRRLATARSARGGGSMPPWMCHRLRREIDSGHVEHLIGTIDRAVFDHDGGQVRVGERQLSVDRCWLATGTRPDARADRALEPHVDRHVDGIPVVHEDLSIDHRPLYFAGRLATLELGPAAGNLWGARIAGRRITEALTGIDLDIGVMAPTQNPARLRTKGVRQ